MPKKLKQFSINIDIYPNNDYNVDKYDTIIINGIMKKEKEKRYGNVVSWRHDHCIG